MRTQLDCGCEFETDDNNKLLMEFDISNINLDCQDTWDLIGTGMTTGLFQIDSGLGQTMSKQLKPQNIDQLAALISIMRPSCIAEDVKIATYHYLRPDNTTERFHKIKIKDLHNQFHNNSNNQYQNRIISYDETNHILINNKIKNIWSNGVQKVYSINFRKRLHSKSHGNRKYNFQCTENHKLFVFNKGWIELKDIKQQDRFLILADGEGKIKPTQQTQPWFGKNIFQNICFRNYEYKCIFCNWLEAPLDVNHLESTKQINNNPDNLCFICPNHHRMYTYNKISKDNVIKHRNKYKLPQNKQLYWAEFESYEYEGTKEVFDIETQGPHHNFIAGDIIVHNCLKATLADGKSIAQHYIDRKNNKESATAQYSALEPILKNTYNLMIYQEQAIQIGKDIAGMSLQDADYYIRYAIGKKKSDIIAKGKDIFLNGCQQINKVNNDEAKAIWEWIESAQRYQFNSSHAYSYAYTTYLTAIGKQHFTKRFFRSYLNHAYDKQKPLNEIKNLVLDSKSFGVDICNPDLRLLNKRFIEKNGRIYFGLQYIKEVGEKTCDDLIKLLNALP